MGNKNVKNDTSAFTCMRLVQDGLSYTKEVSYLETISGSVETSDLAIRLKQLYNDFEADYVVVDTMGAGIGVFDALCKTLYDEERDEEYEPWASMNDEAMNERFVTRGKEVIYSVKASASFNNDIAVALRSALEKGKIALPINDIVKRDKLIAEGGFKILPREEQQRKISTYFQASVLQSELVSLEYEIRAANIVIKEVGTATKDRYSSLAYLNWYANELERRLKEEESTDWSDFMFISGGMEEWRS